MCCKVITIVDNKPLFFADLVHIQIPASFIRVLQWPGVIHIISSQLSWFVCFFCFVYLRPVSCVPNVASFFGLSIILLPLRCSLIFIYSTKKYESHDTTILHYWKSSKIQQKNCKKRPNCYSNTKIHQRSLSSDVYQLYGPKMTVNTITLTITNYLSHKLK